MFMKKLLLFLFLLFSALITSQSPYTVASNNNSNIDAEIMTKKLIDEKNEYKKLYEEIYKKDLILQIELESEVLIPDYIDFKYVEYTYNLAKELDFSPRMAFRLMFRESSFIDTITSPKGAHGLWQLMPETRQSYYESLRVDTLHLDSNQEDIYIGMNYVKDLFAFWIDRGNKETISWKLCLASYNSGKGAVLKYRGIPPYKETIDFVTFILKAHSNPEFYANYSKKYDNTHKNRT